MSESILDTNEFKPIKNRWNKRLAILATREAYYDGSIYRKAGLDSILTGGRFYKNIRPLYLPLMRAVDIDVGIIPQGWTLDEEQPEQMAAAQKALFNMSDWTLEGPLYVHYAAQYGTTGLKISDLREAGRVVMAPYDPQTFMLVFGGTYAREPDYAIIIEERKDEDGKPFEYAEVITADSIRTFYNGQPWGYDDREAEETNELDFVPFVEVPFKNTGKPIGDASFQGTIPMLNELNETASYLAEIIKDHAEPQWFVSGAEPSDLAKSGDNVWFVTDPQGRAGALTANIDISGVLSFIESIAVEVKSSLPELVFDELRAKAQIATETVELQLTELVIKTMRTRPNLDYGLVRAMQMSGRAAADMGLAEVAPLADEGLALKPDRPVIPPPPLVQLKIEQQEIINATARLALEREAAMMRGPNGFEEEPVA